MLATFAAAFSHGAFYLDGDGFLEQDSDSYASLAAKIKPTVAWWREAGE